VQAELQLEQEKRKADREADERRAQLDWEKERWEREEGHRQETRRTEQQKQLLLMNRLKIAADSLKHVYQTSHPRSRISVIFQNRKAFLPV